jgi:TonB-dependent receptor
MNRHVHVFFAAVSGLFAILVPLCFGAGPGATGAVEGRVSNPTNGSYVEGVRVTVEGTAFETFTDADGHFSLAGVPVGDARLRVTYTGAVPAVVPVRVAAGQAAVRDIALELVGRPTAEGEAIRLDRFVVGESREMDGAAIAINDQRIAANIRNVVSTEEFGAVAEGNVAEFLKFMPGVTIDLSGGDGRTISIDGAPAANTPITIGGIGLPAPGNNSTSRSVEVGFFNLNNVSRIEVSHSPTPDSPGSALAGSINLVPRSSFERARPVFNGSLYLMLRDDQRNLDKVPLLYRDRRSPVHPGADFSWIVPVNKRFGFSISAGASTQFSSQDRTTMVWRGVSNATTGAAFPHTTVDRPYLSSFTLQDSPKETQRDSLGLTLDFRLSPRDRIALSYQYSSFDGWTAARTIQFNPNQIVAASISPTAVQGVAGVGAVVLTAGNGRVRENRTYLPTLSWRHEGPVWKLDAAVGRGYGINSYRDTDQGQLLSLTSRRTGVTIGFADVTYLRPGTITVVDNATRLPIDPYRLDSYALQTITSNPRRGTDVNITATANARRDFLWRVPVSLRAGLDFRQSRRDIGAQSHSYTYQGTNTVGSAAPFLDPVTSQRSGPYGFPQIQFPDYKATLDYFKTHPAEFTLDENASYRSYVTASKLAVERVGAAYLRGDLALFDRRLVLVGGLRAEQTNIRAQGPLTDPTRNYQRDANGQIQRAPNGSPQLIVPTSDALGVSRLTYLPRASRVEKEYLRLFPSLNATVHFRENLTLRAAVSTSVGRPDFDQYTGAITLPNTENPPSSSNRFSLNNAAIKPWSATTAKLRLEYYFTGVGQFSVGAFRRHFRNFFGNTVFDATPEFLALYDLDPAEYGAYQVSTQYNLPGTTRMEGWDVAYRQALTFLPSWARGVQVFANISAQKTSAPRGVLGGRAFNEIPRNGAWGLSLTRRKFNVRVNCSFRLDQVANEVTGTGIEPGTYNYTAGFTKIDVLGEYYLWKRLALFANLRNITDVPDEGITAGPNTPAVARLRFRERYGSLWTLGLKGTL